MYTDIKKNGSIIKQALCGAAMLNFKASEAFW